MRSTRGQRAGSDWSGGAWGVHGSTGACGEGASGEARAKSKGV
jgi:hypothetical protein